jgi:hypothetical protein
MVLIHTDTAENRSETLGKSGNTVLKKDVEDQMD